MTDYICDIDGTVADCSHRLHHIRNKPKNWKAFNSEAHLDKPIVETIAIIRSLMLFAGPVHRVIFCTGREERLRKHTLAWLEEHVLPGWSLDHVPLYMRPKNDFREDDTVKEELLARIRQDGFNPVAAFEDRSRVVAMWRRNGIRCYQVETGDF